MWIAGKRMKIKRNGSYVWINPGDPVPEAETWPNRDSWERTGHIRRTRRTSEVAAAVATEIRHAPRPHIVSRPEPSLASPVDSVPDTGRETPTTPEGADTAPIAEPEPTPMPMPKPRAEKDETPPAPAKRQRETCPYCGGDFLDLSRHVCKEAPGYTPKPRAKKKSKRGKKK